MTEHRKNPGTSANDGHGVRDPLLNQGPDTDTETSTSATYQRPDTERSTRSTYSVETDSCCAYISMKLLNAFCDIISRIFLLNEKRDGSILTNIKIVLYVLGAIAIIVVPSVFAARNTHTTIQLNLTNPNNDTLQCYTKYEELLIPGNSTLTIEYSKRYGENKISLPVVCYKQETQDFTGACYYSTGVSNRLVFNEPAHGITSLYPNPDRQQSAIYCYGLATNHVTTKYRTQKHVYRIVEYSFPNLDTNTFPTPEMEGNGTFFFLAQNALDTTYTLRDELNHGYGRGPEKTTLTNKQPIGFFPQDKIPKNLMITNGDDADKSCALACNEPNSCHSISNTCEITEYQTEPNNKGITIYGINFFNNSNNKNPNNHPHLRGSNPSTPKSIR